MYHICVLKFKSKFEKEVIRKIFNMLGAIPGKAPIFPKACFKPLPPVEPQKLLLVGCLPDLSEVPNKMKVFLKNIKEIEHPEGSVYEVEYKSSPIFKAKDAQKLSSFSGGPGSSTKIRNHNKKTSRHVRVLLQQLILNLPVSDSRIPTSVPRELNQLSCMINKNNGSCEIAVQAHSNTIILSKPKKSYMGGEDMGGEEWLGGVRALRDSHVRLVQRQLRHVERLNRALDRVTRNQKTHLT